AHLNTTLDANFVINSLTFTGPGTPADTSNVTIASGGLGTNTLTIEAGSGVGILVNSTSAAHTISANVILGGDQTWTNGSTGAFTVSGTVSSSTNSNLTVAGTGNTVISGAIQTGAGGLTKNDSGALTLSGTNTYSGATNVNGGKLIVSGSLAGSVNVNSTGGVAGTLAGGSFGSASSIAGDLNVAADATTTQVGGTVAPGGLPADATTGVLNVAGNVILGSVGAGVAHLDITLGGTTAGSTYDQIAMSAGNLALTNVELDGALIYAPTVGDTYYIIAGAGTTSGTLAFANQQAPDGLSAGLNTITFGGQEFAISFTALYNGGVGSQFTGAGNDVALMAVPEPASLSMLVGSFGLALGLQRFRRRNRTALRA
ncbi:MAG TPA: autotransporter-associated beta strand repeat-containing protein, partial [Tepidisphaeraceae bacterium]